MKRLGLAIVAAGLVAAADFSYAQAPPNSSGTLMVPNSGVSSGGGGAPSGPAGGVLSGTYPNPGFASPNVLGVSQATSLAAGGCSIGSNTFCTGNATNFVSVDAATSFPTMTFKGSGGIAALISRGSDTGDDFYFFQPTDSGITHMRGAGGYSFEGLSALAGLVTTTFVNSALPTNGNRVRLLLGPNSNFNSGNAPYIESKDLGSNNDTSMSFATWNDGAAANKIALVLDQNGNAGVTGTVNSSALGITSAATDFATKLVRVTNGNSNALFTVTGDGRTSFGADISAFSVATFVNPASGGLSGGSLFVAKDNSVDTLMTYQLRIFSGEVAIGLDSATGILAFGSSGVNNEEMTLDVATGNVAISGDIKGASYHVGATAGASCTLTVVAHLTVVNGIVTLCN